MRALRLTTDGLKLEQIDTPEPGPGDALIRVHAAAITKDELEWPTDRLPAIPSYEVSGEVVATGDQVYALTDFGRDGAAADYAVVPASLLAPKPRSLDHVHSAAIPMPALTAWQGLFDHGRLESGQRVLVTGASGGVGHLAVQLARHRGADVVALTRNDRLEDVEPVDLVFDTVGGELLAQAQALGGRVVGVATKPAPPGIYFIVEPNGAQLAEVTTLVDAGEVQPEIDSVYPLEDFRSAFERLSERGRRGKVVLEIA
jgi:NADPH:quinone reductase-like Zn-dependent oxidoreductase